MEPLKLEDLHHFAIEAEIKSIEEIPSPDTDFPQYVIKIGGVKSSELDEYDEAEDVDDLSLDKEQYLDSIVKFCAYYLLELDIFNGDNAGEHYRDLASRYFDYKITYEEYYQTIENETYKLWWDIKVLLKAILNRLSDFSQENIRSILKNIDVDIVTIPTTFEYKATFTSDKEGVEFVDVKPRLEVEETKSRYLERREFEAVYEEKRKMTEVKVREAVKKARDDHAKSADGEEDLSKEVIFDFEEALKSLKEL